jgi:filamentous hemagglutinin
LLLKHVGQSEQALMKRLADEPHISGSSSFYDRATAERGVSGALDARQAEISTWLSGNKPQMKIEDTRPDPVGITISRDTMQAIDTTNLRLILRRDPSMPTGYRIHTGFPINE